MSPRVVDKDERRKDILAAAVRVFAGRGYAATKVEDVALEAGVAKGTIYLYFDSRDEILRAAFEEFEEGLLAEVRAIAGAREPALERLRSLVRAVLANVEARPELSRVVLDFWAAAVFEGAGKGIDFGRVYATYRGLVGGLLEEAKREGTARRDLPEDAPAVVVGTVEGMVLQWIVDPEALPLRRMAKPALDLLFGGLAGGGGPAR